MSARKKKRKPGAGRKPRVGPAPVVISVRVPAGVRAEFARGADLAGLSQPAYLVACMEAQKRISSVDTEGKSTSQAVATHSEIN